MRFEKWVQSILIVVSTACHPEWREFRSERGDFTIRFPSEPDEFSGSADDYLAPGAQEALGIQETTSYLAWRPTSWWDSILVMIDPGRGAYGVIFGEMSMAVPLSRSSEDLIEEYVRLRIRWAADDDAAGVSPCSRALISTTSLDDSSVPGREIVFKQQCVDPAVESNHRERVIIVNRRLYVLSVVGLKTGSRLTDSSRGPFSKDVDVFFASFQPAVSPH